MTGKKKRSLSDDDDKTEEKASSAAAQNKSSKKQKVNQEKDGRKAQKVIITTHYHMKAVEFCSQVYVEASCRNFVLHFAWKSSLFSFKTFHSIHYNFSFSFVCTTHILKSNTLLTCSRFLEKRRG